MIHIQLMLSKIIAAILTAVSVTLKKIIPRKAHFLHRQFIIRAQQ